MVDIYELAGIGGWIAIENTSKSRERAAGQDSGQLWAVLETLASYKRVTFKRKLQTSAGKYSHLLLET